tara:strand:- start:2411 stop:2680 length:270 start_codon:yes stop_codon:yes gene_type:complete
MWENILKKKRIWYRYVDEIMSDGQARNSKEIYNKLLDYMRSPDASGRSRSGRNIPNVNSLTSYLKGSSKFANVDNIGRNVVWEWVGEEE